MKRRNVILAICGIFCLMFFLLPGRAVCAQTFIHEYFYYTVEDQSVTITGYAGKEKEVTVPNMIGGNPVNQIAAGAFSNCPSVEKVNLPDTIMSVEAGAFSSEIKVEYGETQQINQETGGVKDSDGNLVTVDTEGNLVAVDKNGNETVLDDSGKYSLTKDEKGEVTVKDETGNTVSVTQNGKVSFQDAQGNQVTKDMKEDVFQYVEGVGYEEVDTDADNLQKGQKKDSNGEDIAQEDGNAKSGSALEGNQGILDDNTGDVQETGSGNVQGEHDQKGNVLAVGLIIGIALIVIIVGGIIIARRRNG